MEADNNTTMPDVSGRNNTAISEASFDGNNATTDASIGENNVTTSETSFDGNNATTDASIGENNATASEASFDGNNATTDASFGDQSMPPDMSTPIADSKHGNHNTNTCNLSAITAIKQEVMQAKDVTLMEAQEGVMKAISFLQIHPRVEKSYVDILCSVLHYLTMLAGSEMDYSLMDSSKDELDMTGSKDELDMTGSSSTSELETKADIILTDSVVIGDLGAVLEEPVKRKRGRPPGKGRKSLQREIELETWDPTMEADVELTKSQKKKRGRKPGSKNKKKVEEPLDLDEDYTVSDEGELDGEETPKKAKRSSPTKEKRNKKGSEKKDPDVKEDRQCPHCGKLFQDSKSYRKHVKEVHAETRPFVCQICPLAFKTSYHLKRHDTVHSDTRDHICSDCGAMFKRGSHLLRHKQTHTTEGNVRPMKNFQCDRCPRSYTDSYQLKEHVNGQHEGIRPYICSQCGKDFAYAAALRVHRKQHSSDPRPHICDQCGVSYAARSNLLCHIRHVHTHETPFKCMVCNRGFTRASNLKIHSLIHTGVKPYKCGICHRAFANPGTLLQHKRMHNDIKTFQCEYCEKRFRHSGQMHRHIKGVHGINLPGVNLTRKRRSRAKNPDALQGASTSRDGPGIDVQCTMTGGTGDYAHIPHDKSEMHVHQVHGHGNNPSLRTDDVEVLTMNPYNNLVIQNEQYVQYRYIAERHAEDNSSNEH